MYNLLVVLLTPIYLIVKPVFMLLAIPVNIVKGAYKSIKATLITPKNTRTSFKNYLLALKNNAIDKKLEKEASKFALKQLVNSSYSNPSFLNKKNVNKLIMKKNDNIEKMK